MAHMREEGAEIAPRSCQQLRTSMCIGHAAHGDGPVTGWHARARTSPMTLQDVASMLWYTSDPALDGLLLQQTYMSAEWPRICHCRDRCLYL